MQRRGAPALLQMYVRVYVCCEVRMEGRHVCVRVYVCCEVCMEGRGCSRQAGRFDCALWGAPGMCTQGWLCACCAIGRESNTVQQTRTCVDCLYKTHVYIVVTGGKTLRLHPSVL